MMRAWTAVSSFILLLLISTTFLAGAEESRSDVDISDGKVDPGKVVHPRKLSPLMRSIAAVFESEKKEIAVLRDRLKATRDPMAALAIQREIARIKEDTELSILKLQADAARSQGRAEAAAHLDRAIVEYEAARVHRAAAVR